MKMDEIVEMICCCICEDQYIRFPKLVVEVPTDLGQKIIVTDNEGVVFSIEIKKVK